MFVKFLPFLHFVMQKGATRETSFQGKKILKGRQIKFINSFPETTGRFTVRSTTLVTEKIQDRVNPSIIGGGNAAEKSSRIITSYPRLPGRTSGTTIAVRNKGLLDSLAPRPVRCHAIAPPPCTQGSVCIGQQRIYARILSLQVYLAVAVTSNLHAKLAFSAKIIPPFLITVHTERSVFTALHRK